MTAAQILKDVSEQYRIAFDAGRKAERDGALQPIFSVYDKFKNDPNARIPTALALVIEHARAA